LSGGEAVDDDRDLEELGDSVVALRLVDELEEDVVDRAANEGAELRNLP